MNSLGFAPVVPSARCAAPLRDLDRCRGWLVPVPASRRAVRVLLLAGLALLGLSAWGQRLEGRVEKVTDGDSIWVRVEAPWTDGTRPDGPVLKVRVTGIDAPERCQSHGLESSQALRDRLLGRAVHLAPSGVDAYERHLARVTLDGEDIGAWMVASGHAWSYSRKSTAERPGGRYAREQRAAQAAGRGLFLQPQAVPPWVFRRFNGPCPSGG